MNYSVIKTQGKHDFRSNIVNSEVWKSPSEIMTVNYGIHYVLMWKIFSQIIYSNTKLQNI